MGSAAAQNLDDRKALLVGKVTSARSAPAITCRLVMIQPFSRTTKPVPMPAGVRIDTMAGVAAAAISAGDSERAAALASLGAAADEVELLLPDPCAAPQPAKAPTSSATRREGPEAHGKPSLRNRPRFSSFS